MKVESARYSNAEVVTAVLYNFVALGLVSVE